MRNLAGLVVVFLLLASAASGQTVMPGTFELSGVTGVLVNRQTISQVDSNGRLQAGDANLTIANVGLETTYYITPHVGIGALVSYQHVSVEASDKSALFDVSGGFFGPTAKVRLPLGDRSEFVIVGSGGGVKTRLVNQNTGVGANVSSHLDGRYWLLGGGLSFRLLPAASFDVGVRYQSSTFSGRTTEDGEAKSAGLLVGIAFSIYLH